MSVHDVRHYVVTCQTAGCPWTATSRVEEGAVVLAEHHETPLRPGARGAHVRHRTTTTVVDHRSPALPGGAS